MFLALLLVSAPTPGYYYREAFAKQVRDGAWDPDDDVTAREMNVQVTASVLRVDYGQEIEEQPLAKAVAVDKTHIKTSVLGEEEVLVRLAGSYDELAKVTRAARTAARRKALLGTYQAEGQKPIVLGPKTTFELTRCYVDCEEAKVTTCLKVGKALWQVDDKNRVLSAASFIHALCMLGSAIEVKPDAQRFVKAD